MFDRRFLKIKRDSSYNFEKKIFLRLDANERIIPFSKTDLSAIKKNINDYIIQSYPTNRDTVTRLICKKEKLPIDKICLTPGADTVLKYIFELISKNKGSILSVYPTYGMIDVYCNIYQKKHIKILENNLQKFLIKKNYLNISLVYIAYPNSPSGKIIPKNIILEIANICKQKKILFVIDEAYIEYSKQVSLKDLVKKYNNILIIRTYSKYFGLAGLRIGHVIGAKNIIQAINSVRPPHDISNLSLKILEYFLQKKKDTYLKEFNKSKEYIQNYCEINSLNHILTEGNFFHIIFDIKTIKKILIGMKKNNILIKSNYLNFSNTLYKGPKNTIRVSIGSINQMKFFFKTLNKIINT